MIVCKRNEAAKYKVLTPRIAAALDWLETFDDKNFEQGEIALSDDVIVKCECPSLISKEQARLELHRKWIDIHVPLAGTETIGWAPASDLHHEIEKYDEAKDISFWGDAANSILHITPGMIAIFFPEDAHAPNIGIGKHRKLCIKIRV